MTCRPCGTVTPSSPGRWSLRRGRRSTRNWSSSPGPGPPRPDPSRGLTQPRAGRPGPVVSAPPARLVAEPAGEALVVGTEVVVKPGPQRFRHRRAGPGILRGEPGHAAVRQAEEVED